MLLTFIDFTNLLALVFVVFFFSNLFILYLSRLGEFLIDNFNSIQSVLSLEISILTWRNRRCIVAVQRLVSTQILTCVMIRKILLSPRGSPF